MRKTRIIALTLIICLLFTSFPTYASESNPVGQFVKRLYNICLDREPDETGYNNWVNALQSKEKTGAEVAYGFIFSKEFRDKNLCNSCYLDSLYRCFLGREADEAGKTDWLNKMNSSATRGSIFNGFVGSQEFTNICNDYGINRGFGDWSKEDMTTTGVCKNCAVSNSKVKEFVTRLYSVCLDRLPDEKGLSDWVTKALNGTSGAQLAFGFVFSMEFQNKSLCDEHFVDYMYRAFFGREADKEGKTNWVNLLSSGAARGAVFDGFIGSQEFINLCASYKIEAGRGYYGYYHFNQYKECPVCEKDSEQNDNDENIQESETDEANNETES